MMPTATPATAGRCKWRCSVCYAEAPIAWWFFLAMSAPNWCGKVRRPTT
jgi:hypothetical protein